MSKEREIGTNPGDATEGARMDIISSVLFSLEQMEFGGKPIEAKAELGQRLTELSQGKAVPLVVFNCLEFTWQPNGNRYPKSVVSGDPQTAITGYFQDEIQLIKLELETIGKPALRIIVPDSELFDERVFSFAQTTQERTKVAEQVKLDLSQRLAELNDPDSPIVLWSDYCREQRLFSPREYTKKNYTRITGDPELLKKVREQVRDSKKYFEKNGLFSTYIKYDFLEKIAWYCAMYAGEGQALAESRAIVLNFEDRRVPDWFQRGADDKLPILNPGDPFAFYAWRRSLLTKQS